MSGENGQPSSALEAAGQETNLLTTSTISSSSEVGDYFNQADQGE